MGACIRYAKDYHEARVKILREVGEYNGIQELREATKADITFVRAMGGFVPSDQSIRE